MTSLDNTDVALYVQPGMTYPEEPPYHPSEMYPEYRLGGGFKGKDNAVYRSFRACLLSLGLDRPNAGNPAWNPLGILIRPGDHVFVMPDLVEDTRAEGTDERPASVTHGSVIRAVLDYVLIALSGHGKVTIADAPAPEGDFNRVIEFTAIGTTAEFLRTTTGVPIDVFDIRDRRLFRDANGMIVRREDLRGDPRGYAIVDLGERSLFRPVERFSYLNRSAAAMFDNDAAAVHRAGKHLYSVSRTLVESDVLVTLPKLKVHGKMGAKLSLGNMLGTTNRRAWLPQYRFSSPRHGGDMFPDDATFTHRFRETILDFLSHTPVGRYAADWTLALLNTPLVERLERRRKKLGWTEGEWQGNDTAWRSALDLALVALYADGRDVRRLPARRFFAVIDGICGGEKGRPNMMTKKASGVLALGFNPVAVDWVAASVMGMDPGKLPIVAGALGAPAFPPGVGLSSGGIRVVVNGQPAKPIPNLEFALAAGWAGKVERGSGQSSEPRGHSK